MVWGCIWLDGRGKARRSELVIMERDPDSPRNGYSAKSYINALELGLLPHYRPGHIFQQDNASVHVASESKDWLESHGIHVMDWPALSPDLNPIEHMWWALKWKLYELYPNISNMGNSDNDREFLRQALKELWRQIPDALIYRLISSMPRRLQALRKAGFRHTKY